MGLSAAFFYLFFHSTFYNFDGVACAIAVETTDYAHLVHGNHLGYGLAGLAFYRLWQLLGYQGPALLALQTMDSMLGGIGIGLFCAILIRLKIPRLTCAAAASCLALSLAYWLWSLEAQVYMLGVVFILLALDEALMENPRPAVLGLWHALAILGHAGHIMFLPVAVYRLRHRTRYALTLGIILAAAYGAAALFFVRPHSYEDWRIWLLGSAALTTDRSFRWHGGALGESLTSWAFMTLRIFSDQTLVRGPARLFAYALSAAALIAAAYAALTLRRGGRRTVVLTALIWLASYALLFSSWEPYTIVYRISDLIAFWLLIALAAQRLPKAGAAALAAWAMAAGVFNGLTAIASYADPLRNKAYQEALWIKTVTPENAWVVAAGLGQVYIPYFAQRRPLSMQRLNRLDDLAAAGEPVFISSRTLYAAHWSGVFQEYGLQPAQTGLYRVKRARKSSGSSQKKLKIAPALKNGPNGIGSERLSLPRQIMDTP